jgi:transcriptional regulator with XRE-family HTH domain
MQDLAEAVSFIPDPLTQTYDMKALGRLTAELIRATEVVPTMILMWFRGWLASQKMHGRDVSNADIARATKLSQAVIAELLTGKRVPSIEQAIMLAEMMSSQSESTSSLPVERALKRGAISAA